MYFKEEHLADFLTLFEENKDKISHFPGCSHLELWRDEDDPTHLATYSLWESPDHLENYRRSDLFRNVWKLTKSLFREKPKATSFSRQNA